MKFSGMKDFEIVSGLEFRAPVCGAAQRGPADVRSGGAVAGGPG
jgi:hypothetical protein